MSLLAPYPVPCRASRRHPAQEAFSEFFPSPKLDTDHTSSSRSRFKLRLQGLDSESVESIHSVVARLGADQEDEIVEAGPRYAILYLPTGEPRAGDFEGDCLAMDETLVLIPPGQAAAEARLLEQGALDCVPVTVDGFEELLEARLRRLFRSHTDCQGQVLRGECYKIAMEANEMAIWDWNIETGHTYFNREWAAMLGYEREEISPHADAWLNLLHPEDRERVWASQKAYLDGEQPSYNEQMRMRTKTGAYHWVETRGKIYKRDGAGQPLRIVGTHRDITHEKDRETWLQLFCNALKATADAIMITDAEGKIEWINDGFTAMTGYAREEAVGKDARMLRSGQHTQEFYEELWHTVMSGKPWEGQLINKRKDGTLYYEEQTLTPLFDNARKITNLISVKRDVSNRQARENELARQAHLLDLSGDVIIVFDTRLKLQYCNPRARRALGLPDKCGGNRLSDFVDLGRKWDQALFEAVLHGGVWSGEVEMTQKSGPQEGAKVILEAHARLLREQGQRERVFFVGADVTRRREMEAQFLRSQRLEGIGNLAGGIAHDLNNILAPILMSVGLLRREALSEQGKKFVGIVERSAERASGLVQQVLTFARGIEGERAVIDPRILLNDLSEFTRETFPPNIEIEFDLKDELPRTLGDLTQLHQVLLNLCVNARDAMPNGGRLKVNACQVIVGEDFARRHGLKATGPYLELCVEDTGCGIPPDVRHKIFEPFFSTKRKESGGSGTGLGLSTSIGIIRSHHGVITVESELDCGSAFHVYLPVAKGGQTADEAEEAFELPDGQDELLLLVDDERAICTAGQTLLQGSGYRVLIAGDGAEGLECFKRYQDDISLVVTDLLMPKMGGIEMVTEIRKLDPRVPIVAATGYSDDDKVLKLREIGVRYIIQKPFNAYEMLRVIHNLLQEAVHDA